MSKVQILKAGDVVVDSLPFSQSGTAKEAQGLAEHRVKALAGYVGVISKERVQLLLDAGIGYLPVTLAGEYLDGPDDELRQLFNLGVPLGTTVFLDLEGMKAFKANSINLIAEIRQWADAINRAGYVAGLYVGVPQPLTSDELWDLPVTRYWRGQGSVRDRFSKLAEPTGCGWCMTQMYPSFYIGATYVDANMVGQDYKGRTPTVMVAR